MGLKKLILHDGEYRTVAELAVIAGCSEDKMLTRLRCMSFEAAMDYKSSRGRKPDRVRVEPWLGFSTLRYEHDRVAQRVCGHGPYTLEEVGQMLGITRERVRQIEQQAIRKLARVMQSNGVDGEELRSWLMELAGQRDAREVTEDDR